MRKQTKALFLLLLFFSGCSPRNYSLAPAKTPADRTPRNIILLIGDGMGVAQVSSSFYCSEEPPNFQRFPFIGLNQTTPADGNKITDSAAAGTALACGIKTYNKAVGMGLDKKAHLSILVRASEMGKSTGIIATSSLVHATPAAFYAHVAHRDSFEEIARQFVYAPVDFAAAGGRQFFNQRKDGLNYLDSLISKQVILDTTGFVDGKLSLDNRYVFLLAPDSLPSLPNGRGNFLADATEKAIGYLSQNKTGFFLMIEGSQIDWGGHQNESNRVIEEVADFDKAIGAALDFAEKDGNTLVIVTADHETGGFALSSKQKDGKANYGELSPTFSTKDHTASLVPVFAFGPGSKEFAGVYQNTDIFHKMVKILLR